MIFLCVFHEPQADLNKGLAYAQTCTKCKSTSPKIGPLTAMTNRYFLQTRSRGPKTIFTITKLNCAGKERQMSIFSEIQKIVPIKPLRFEVSIAKIYSRESVQVVVSGTIL